MRSNIQLNQRQQLALTPQLQQAINLLQLSAPELSRLIQDAVESNPLLEMDEGISDEPAYDAQLGERETTTLWNEHDLNNPSEYDQSSVTIREPEVDIAAQQFDTSWDDAFDYGSSGKKASEPHSDIVDWYASETTSIQDHLTWQLISAHLSPVQTQIATVLLDGIDDDGFLKISLDDVTHVLKGSVSTSEVEEVLGVIQSLEPVGVGARDLRECMLIQLNVMPAHTAGRDLAIRLVKEHLDLLADHDYAQLKRLYHFSQEQLETALQLVQSLTPRPGSLLDTAPTPYVVPDVIVKKQANSWKVELNDVAFPRIHINQYYAALNKNHHKKLSADNKDEAYIRSHLQDARCFLKSLQNRHLTLLRVASYVIEHQADFLEYGSIGLRPLVLRDVAEALGLHESTISRITTNKYLATPQGVFELKHFFSNSVGSEQGEQCAATAIRAYIKKLVAHENPVKPLSDNRIAEHLLQRGLQVARRTITKYREAMLIPPAHKRKQVK